MPGQPSHKAFGLVGSSGSIQNSPALFPLTGSILLILLGQQELELDNTEISLLLDVRPHSTCMSASTTLSTPQLCHCLAPGKWR